MKNEGSNERLQSDNLIEIESLQFRKLELESFNLKVKI